MDQCTKRLDTPSPHFLYLSLCLSEFPHRLLSFEDKIYCPFVTYLNRYLMKMLLLHHFVLM
jgi:hypothetical protein